MRTHRVLPFCALGLLGLPSLAPATPARVPLPLPRHGEIRLDGVVAESLPAQKSLRMTVTTVTSAAGTITALPAPRQKMVLLSAATRLATGRDLQAGDVVSVIGGDSGPGRPLAARSLVVVLSR